MVDSPGYGSSSVLDSFLFDGGPQSPSAHARGAFLRIDDGIVEVAKEIDDKAAFGRRGARGAVAATTNRNFEVVTPARVRRRSCLSQRLRCQRDALHCIDCPSCYRL